MNEGTRRRSATLVTAVATALIGWTMARMIGIDLTVGKGDSPDRVGAIDVTVAAVVAWLAAWGTYSVLVRTAAERWWPFLGSTALSVSMVGPGWLADGASAVALIGLHLAVGAVLIAGFAGVPDRSGRCVDQSNSAYAHPPGGLSG